MAEYEVMWIIAPTLTEDEVQETVNQFEELLTAQGAKLTKTDVWGRRKLAYPIKKFREGVYVLFHLESEIEPLREMERRFKMTDQVIRFLTVRLDEDMRRARKREAARAAKRPAEAAQADATMTGEAEAAAEPQDTAGAEQVAAEPEAEQTADEPEAEQTADEPEAEPEGDKS
jgi:small subunit ribosomal protein S6